MIAEEYQWQSHDDWMLHQDTRMYLPDDILTKVDRMSMAASLEARVPLLDHRIVEFAATVPFHLKYHQGVSKRLVKHALRNTLPPTLLRQRKQGFSIPIQRWMRQDLKDHIQETLQAPDAHCKPFLSQNYIAQLQQDHLANRQQVGHHLWALLMFEHWLRFIDDVPGLHISY